MGKKIITVDLNFPTSAALEEEVDEVEDKKDEYTEVKEEASNPGFEPNPPPPLESSPGPSKRRKPPSKEKKNVAEPVVEADPIEPEPVVVDPPPIKVGIDSKDTQKVKCQHCNKEMSMKSLKYSHSRNCLGLKRTIEKVSNEKVSHLPKAEAPSPCKAEEPPPAYKLDAPTLVLPVKMKTCAEQHMAHPRVARMNALKEKYNSLVQNAFNV